MIEYLSTIPPTNSEDVGLIDDLDASVWDSRVSLFFGLRKCNHPCKMFYHSCLCKFFSYDLIVDTYCVTIHTAIAMSIYIVKNLYDIPTTSM